MSIKMRESETRTADSSTDLQHAEFGESPSALGDHMCDDTADPRKLVVVPNTKTLIKESPGFHKKDLSDYKLDLLALCEFGCRYCSSNTGNYLRIYRSKFAKLTEEQLGERVLPSEDPALMFVYTDVLGQLRRELDEHGPTWGSGRTLMFSMLTDGFSPYLVEQGITRAALELIMAKTKFRVRILTKNAVVGTGDWIEFLLKHKDRFVVGLSTGSTNDDWARAVEVGTSAPTERLRALRNLQDAGVPTYGMACPVFPDVLAAGNLDALVDQIRPEKVETFWAEPYNDRLNWERVRSGYAPESSGYEWFTRVFGTGDKAAWSRYATDLYVRLVLRAEAEGWTSKLKYLLYESGITQNDARYYCSTKGLMLQSPSDEKGFSKNPHVREVQKMIHGPNAWDRLMSDYSVLDDEKNKKSLADEVHPEERPAKLSSGSGAKRPPG